MSPVPATAKRRPLDPTEKRIVRLLQEDGRMSTAEIARRLGISEPTARKRLAQIQAEGLIRIRVSAEPADLGFEASAFIGIDVERAALGRVAETLKAYAFVDSVAVTTGPYDLMIKACFETLRDLYDFIFIELAAVEGIKDSHSFMVLHTFKNEGLVGVPGVPEPAER